MQARSILDIYACVPEYCIDADDREGSVRAADAERPSVTLAWPFWVRLTSYLFPSPA